MYYLSRYQGVNLRVDDRKRQRTASEPNLESMSSHAPPPAINGHKRSVSVQSVNDMQHFCQLETIERYHDDKDGDEIEVLQLIRTAPASCYRGQPVRYETNYWGEVEDDRNCGKDIAPLPPDASVYEKRKWIQQLKTLVHQSVDSISAANVS
jgi:hypothetical protein